MCIWHYHIVFLEPLHLHESDSPHIGMGREKHSSLLNNDWNQIRSMHHQWHIITAWFTKHPPPHCLADLFRGAILCITCIVSFCMRHLSSEDSAYLDTGEGWSENGVWEEKCREQDVITNCTRGNGRPVSLTSFWALSRGSIVRPLMRLAMSPAILIIASSSSTMPRGIAAIEAMWSIWAIKGAELLCKE